MKHFTKRLLSALTGFSMLTAGMNIPQFTAAAETADNTVTTGSYLLESEEKTLLNVQGELMKDGEVKIEFSGADLGGEVYDEIVAEVCVQPNDPTHTLEQATVHTFKMAEGSNSVVYAPNDDTREESFENPPYMISLWDDNVYKLYDRDDVQLIRDAESDVMSTKFGVFSQMKESESFELTISFQDDTQTTEVSGNYYILILGCNYLTNHMPPAENLSLLGETEYAVDADTPATLLNTTGTSLQAKDFSRFILTAEFTPGSGMLSKPYEQMYTAMFSSQIETYQYETIEGTDDTPPMTNYTTSNYGCNLPTWMHKGKGAVYTASAIIEPDKINGIYGTMTTCCEILIGSASSSRQKSAEGKVMLKLYGYEPDNNPDEQFLHKIMSVYGRQNGASGSSEALTEFDFIPTAFYCEAKAPRESGDIANVNIKVLRSSSENGDQKNKQVWNGDLKIWMEPIDRDETAVANMKEVRRGIVKLEDAFQLQAGDRVEITAAITKKDGTEQKNGECLVTLYGYGVSHPDNTPAPDKLTLLAQMTGDINDAAIYVSNALLDLKPFERFYVTAEYEPNNNNIPEEPVIAVFDTITKKTESSETESGPVSASVSDSFTNTAPFHSSDGKYLSAFWIEGGAFGKDGSLHVSCKLYQDYAQTEVTTGLVQLTVYGYDPYNLPLTDDLHEIITFSSEKPFAAIPQTSAVLDYNCSGMRQFLITATSNIVDEVYVFVDILRDMKLSDGTIQKESYCSAGCNIKLLNHFGVYQLDWDIINLQPQPGDEIIIDTKTYRNGLDYTDIGNTSITLYGIAEELPPLSKMTLLGETETELSKDTVAGSVEVKSDQLYKTGFTDYYAVAEYDGTAEAAYIGIEKETVTTHVTDDQTPAVTETASSGDFINSEARFHNGTMFIPLGRPELGSGTIKVTVAPHTGDTQATSGKLTVKIYGYNRYQMPDYDDMDHLFLSATNFFNGKDSFTLDASYGTLWLQTRQRVVVDTDDRYSVTVLRGGQTISETNLTDFAMINGTRIAKLDPAALGAQVGDQIRIKREVYDFQKQMDLENGWQIAVFGDKTPAPSGKRGDVNCDGSIDVADAVLLARFIAEDNTASISGAGIANADTNKSGTPDSNDVILILKYIARMIREF